MIPILTPEELRGIESQAADAGLPLMEQAGAACAEAAIRLAGGTGRSVLVVAGPGNNGGDAWVAARCLQQRYERVCVLDAGGAEPRAAPARAARAQFTAQGGSVLRDWPPGERWALVVDGLLGLGLTRDVEAGYAALIDHINAAGAPVLAIDVPSGLDGSSGRVRGAAVRATETLTFIAHKPGLHTADGPDCCGRVTVDELGLAAAVAAAAHGTLLTPELAAPWLVPRRRNSHKGDFGTLAVVGGHRGMVGAALLAARAALLAGAGRVYAGLLAPDAPGVDLVHPELMLRGAEEAIEAARVVVAGPGAGRSPSATSASTFERRLLPELLAGDRALVLDADALNAIATNEALAASLPRRIAPTLLTPHPAEAARLLATDTGRVQSDRLGTALRLARELNAHVVLKGAGSVCAFPDGRWSINTTGNPGLASAGSGDVLAGIAGALLCQGLEAERALQYAVCLHGAAADACVARGLGPMGLTASEVALEARTVMNRWCGGGE
jgi:hydroxyethylthiazole kinase-like uncharacterized protein yjeF